MGLTTPAEHNSAERSSLEHDSFPRLSARTLRFTLGEPRNITITHDGSRVLFVRTASGIDRVGALWMYDVDTAAEHLLADPATLLSGSVEDLPPEERARRERQRESGAGVTSYTIDRAGTRAVFALSGQVWVCEIPTGNCRQLDTAPAAIDPRLDPTGKLVAYSAGRALRIVGVASDFDADADGSGDRALVDPAAAGDRALVDPAADGEPETVAWGQAEFIAAEEMSRYRGFWWAPDGQSLLVERYDNAPVQTWYITDPAHPDREPAAHRYPAAGTANADVSLWHIALDGTRLEIPWDRTAFPYLARVSWKQEGAVISVLSRDQRTNQVLRLRMPSDGEGLGDGDRPSDNDRRRLQLTEVAVEVAAELTDPDWLDIIAGVPTLTPDGRLLTSVNDYAEPATRRLAVDGEPVSPAGVQIEAVRWVGDESAIAIVAVDSTERQLARLGFDGSIDYLTSGAGVYRGAVGGPDGSVVVVAASAFDRVGTAMTVYRGGVEVGQIASLATAPGLSPSVQVRTVGERDLRAGVVFPTGHEPGSRRLPVIMAPYGGPHAQLLLAAGRMFLQAQYLADQGFAVVVSDGRGTPGRGPKWERAVRDELAAVTLQDQVDALAGMAEQYPADLDTDRVGIMGWSYGGYLAALAVLDRPDIFHAAVAGAPVTDWTLYDTCYTERYLGNPIEQPEIYRRNSLIDRAPQLTRPLLLIHGLADDNVVFAHTLRLSGALLAAGKLHQVMPLTGVTHMASAEDIAENLLLAQVSFLKESLGA